MQRFGATRGIGIFGGLVAGAYTVLFLGMRSVMDIGGSCGSVGTPSCPGRPG